MFVSVGPRPVAESSRAALDRFIRAAIVEHPTVARFGDSLERAGVTP